MTLRSGLIIVSALVMFGMVSSVFAAGKSSFSISSPPITDPVYDQKETDLKVGANHLAMKSSASTTSGSDFKLDGYGISAVDRSAFGNQSALDCVGARDLSKAKGAGTGLKRICAWVPISVNLEVQPYKNDAFNVIVFGGPAFIVSSMTLYTVPAPDFANESWTIDSYLSGLQGGVQMGFRLGDVYVDFFRTMDSRRGTRNITTTVNSGTSEGIPAFMTISYGLDLLYYPWGLTLSSILQEAKQSYEKGTKKNIYTISWSYRF